MNLKCELTMAIYNWNILSNGIYICQKCKYSGSRLMLSLWCSAKVITLTEWYQ
jgi:hypothetical protein